MAGRSNHKHSCVLLPGSTATRLTTNLFSSLTEGNERLMKKYPVYLCFSNACFGEEEGGFRLKTVDSIGSVINTALVKEIDFGGNFLTSFSTSAFSKAKDGTMSGNLPTFKDLHHLSILDLSHNQLEGSIINLTSVAPHLLQLDLSYNKFSWNEDELSQNATVIADMMKLERLNLSNNPFCTFFEQEWENYFLYPLRNGKLNYFNGIPIKKQAKMTPPDTLILTKQGELILHPGRSSPSIENNTPANEQVEEEKPSKAPENKSPSQQSLSAPTRSEPATPQIPLPINDETDINGLLESGQKVPYTIFTDILFQCFEDSSSAILHLDELRKKLRQFTHFAIAHRAIDFLNSSAQLFSTDLVNSLCRLAGQSADLYEHALATLSYIIVKVTDAGIGETCCELLRKRDQKNGQATPLTEVVGQKVLALIEEECLRTRRLETLPIIIRNTSSKGTESNRDSLPSQDIKSNRLHPTNLLSRGSGSGSPYSTPQGTPLDWSLNDQHYLHVCSSLKVDFEQYLVYYASMHISPEDQGKIPTVIHLFLAMCLDTPHRRENKSLLPECLILLALLLRLPFVLVQAPGLKIAEILCDVFDTLPNFSYDTKVQTLHLSLLRCLSGVAQHPSCGNTIYRRDVHRKLLKFIDDFDTTATAMNDVYAAGIEVGGDMSRDTIELTAACIDCITGLCVCPPLLRDATDNFLFISKLTEILTMPNPSALLVCSAVNAMRSMLENTDGQQDKQVLFDRFLSSTNEGVTLFECIGGDRGKEIIHKLHQPSTAGDEASGLSDVDVFGEHGEILFSAITHPQFVSMCITVLELCQTYVNAAYRHPGARKLAMNATPTLLEIYQIPNHTARLLCVSIFSSFPQMLTKAEQIEVLLESLKINTVTELVNGKTEHIVISILHFFTCLLIEDNPIRPLIQTDMFISLIPAAINILVINTERHNEKNRNTKTAIWNGVINLLKAIKESDWKGGIEEMRKNGPSLKVIGTNECNYGEESGCCIEDTEVGANIENVLQAFVALQSSSFVAFRYCRRIATLLSGDYERPHCLAGGTFSSERWIPDYGRMTETPQRSLNACQATFVKQNGMKVLLQYFRSQSAPTGQAQDTFVTDNIKKLIAQTTTILDQSGIYSLTDHRQNQLNLTPSGATSSPSKASEGYVSPYAIANKRAAPAPPPPASSPTQIASYGQKKTSGLQAQSYTNPLNAQKNNSQKKKKEAQNVIVVNVGEALILDDEIFELETISTGENSTTTDTDVTTDADISAEVLAPLPDPPPFTFAPTPEHHPITLEAETAILCMSTLFWYADPSVQSIIRTQARNVATFRLLFSSAMAYGLTTLNFGARILTTTNELFCLSVNESKEKAGEAFELYDVVSQMMSILFNHFMAVLSITKGEGEEDEDKNVHKEGKESALLLLNGQVPNKKSEENLENQAQLSHSEFTGNVFFHANSSSLSRLAISYNSPSIIWITRSLSPRWRLSHDEELLLFETIRMWYVFTHQLQSIQFHVSPNVSHRIFLTIYSEFFTFRRLTFLISTLLHEYSRLTLPLKHSRALLIDECIGYIICMISDYIRLHPKEKMKVIELINRVEGSCGFKMTPQFVDSILFRIELDALCYNHLVPIARAIKTGNAALKEIASIEPPALTKPTTGTNSSAITTYRHPHYHLIPTPSVSDLVYESYLEERVVSTAMGVIQKKHSSDNFKCILIVTNTGLLVFKIEDQDEASVKRAVSIQNGSIVGNGYSIENLVYLLQLRLMFLTLRIPFSVIETVRVSPCGHETSILFKNDPNATFSFTSDSWWSIQLTVNALRQGSIAHNYPVIVDPLMLSKIEEGMNMKQEQILFVGIAYRIRRGGKPQKRVLAITSKVLKEYSINDEHRIGNPTKFIADVQTIPLEEFLAYERNEARKTKSFKMSFVETKPDEEPVADRTTMDCLFQSIIPDSLNGLRIKMMYLQGKKEEEKKTKWDFTCTETLHQFISTFRNEIEKLWRAQTF
ncbi:hypothetical protein BLNAU_12902 [Blattamonas nauphoetae]|uniref:HECT-type E3 ubiquitin transferase n=1 Tax=Blattamonas nauphoetae TaxID=2049346 RepID=A0ABQ9XL61_9EUKA|nr:hypothetical protein BLNAU_12902 [Blattamonas nauphoetae]